MTDRNETAANMGDRFRREHATELTALLASEMDLKSSYEGLVDQLWASHKLPTGDASSDQTSENSAA